MAIFRNANHTSAGVHLPPPWPHVYCSNSLKPLPRPALLSQLTAMGARHRVRSEVVHQLEPDAHGKTTANHVTSTCAHTTSGHTNPNRHHGSSVHQCFPSCAPRLESTLSRPTDGTVASVRYKAAELREAMSTACLPPTPADYPVRGVATTLVETASEEALHTSTSSTSISR